MAVRDIRDIHGVLLLDKPVGVTSNAALQTTKHLFRARKAGHTGSLDPLASGMLPVCLGEATKVSGFLLNADKHYHFVCRLGVTTTTGDAEGAVVASRPIDGVNLSAVQAVLPGFLGELEQVPPMYSAIKHQGRRLYEFARRGVEVDRKPRTVTIKALELLSYAGSRLECRVHCSKGTYVRTLAEQVGAALGCGAHIEELRRISVTPFDEYRMVSLESLRDRATEGHHELDRLLLPADSAIVDWPAIRVPANASECLHNGQAVTVPKAPAQGMVRLYEADDRFFGVGRILDDGRVAPSRLIRAG